MPTRRRKNFSMKDIPAGAFAKRWFKVDGVKRKIPVVQAAEYRRQGRKVEETVAPVRRGPRKKKRKTTRRKATRRKTTRRKSAKRKTTRRKTTRKATRKRKTTTRRRKTRRKSTRGKRWYKVGTAKKHITKKTAENYRKRGFKVRVSSAPKSRR